MCVAEAHWPTGQAIGTRSDSLGNLGNFVGSSRDPQLVTGNNGSYWPLNPWQLGARTRDLANCGYSMYRVKKCIIHYIPAVHANPVVNNPANNAFLTSPFSVPNPASGLSVSVNTELAFGFQRDPSTGPMTFTEIIQSGGKIFDSRRKFSYRIQARFPWLYTGLLNSPVDDIVPDIRQTYFGQINSYWRNFCPYVNDVLTTGDVRVAIGDYWVEWVCQFKFPIDTTSDDPARSIVISRTLSLAHPSSANKPPDQALVTTPFEEVKSSEEADEDLIALERKVQAVFVTNSVPVSLRSIQKTLPQLSHTRMK